MSDAAIKTDELNKTPLKEGETNNSQKVAAPSDRPADSNRPLRKNIRKPRRRERTKAEFDSKIISIRRVTRVVSGGRRFSFSVSLVAGDKNGSVGVGIGKATDTSLAIEKAMKDAKKNMVTFSLTSNNSIPFDVRSKFTSSDVMMAPAPGKGLSAGSSVHTVLDMAGITDVSAKLYSRSKNQLNNARAAVNALKKIGYKKYHKPKMAEQRGKFGPKNRREFDRHNKG